MTPKTKKWLELECIGKEPFVPKKNAQPAVHLLVKGQHRVVCVPNQQVGNKQVTIYPSKVTCRNCILKTVRKNKHAHRIS